MCALRSSDKTSGRGGGAAHRATFVKTAEVLYVIACLPDSGYTLEEYETTVKQVEGMRFRRRVVIGGDFNISLISDIAGVTGAAVEQRRRHRGQAADEWAAKREFWVQLCLENNIEACTTFDFNKAPQLGEVEKVTAGAGRSPEDQSQIDFILGDRDPCQVWGLGQPASRSDHAVLWVTMYIGSPKPRALAHKLQAMKTLKGRARTDEANLDAFRSSNTKAPRELHRKGNQPGGAMEGQGVEVAETIIAETTRRHGTREERNGFRRGFEAYLPKEPHHHGPRRRQPGHRLRAEERAAEAGQTRATQVAGRLSHLATQSSWRQQV